LGKRPLAQRMLRSIGMNVPHEVAALLAQLARLLPPIGREPPRRVRASMVFRGQYG
jgi:hypothetical protein